MKKKPKKILIMGPPGAEKTTITEKLAPLINKERINADKVKTKANERGFIIKVRSRQSVRIRDLAQILFTQGRFIIADFAFLTIELRQNYNANFYVREILTKFKMI